MKIISGTNSITITEMLTQQIDMEGLINDGKLLWRTKSHCGICFVVVFYDWIAGAWSSRHFIHCISLILFLFNNFCWTHCEFSWWHKALLFSFRMPLCHWYIPCMYSTCIRNVRWKFSLTGEFNSYFTITLTNHSYNVLSIWRHRNQ